MLGMEQRPQMELQQHAVAGTILIVDDEAIIRDLCSRALKDFRTIQAADGEEGFSLFCSERVDVVLTDVMMPKMDGIELLRRIKEREPTAVVLIMTGFADKEIILNALKEDADDFITKPLNLLQLKTAVQKAIDRRRLKEEITTLRRIDRMKSEFISLVSHKFRTPLTAISLFLQNLTAGVYDPDDPESRHQARLIYQESLYLERLVSELLEFGRMMETDDRLRRTVVVLPPLLKEVFQQALLASPERRGEVTFRGDEIPPVEIDTEKILFAFRQVLDNALKFCRDGEVSVIVDQEGGMVRIRVADCGPGIPATELPKIFEKFYQVDAHRTGQVRGFGLGLTYARTFIAQHGGQITVESREGEGTTVTILLPIATPQTE